MKSWFEIKNRSKTSADVYIYDEIGHWGVTAKDFIDEIKGLKDADIDLHINSPGGSVADALAIYNNLKQWGGNTTAYIDGIAASAASIIAMGAKTVKMPKNSYLMIHDPIGMAIGKADEIQKTVDLLRNVTQMLVNIYVAKVDDKITEEQVIDFLSDETWLAADDALAYGFADEIIDEVKIAAIATDYSFKSLPDALKVENEPAEEHEEFTPTELPTAQAILSAFTEVGAAECAAEFLVNQPDQDALNAEVARIKAIRSICVGAGLQPEQYIKANFSKKQMGLVATELAAAKDVVIDTTQPTKQETPRPAPINTAKIYAARRNTAYGESIY